jgi:hypothetical protein
MNSQSWVNKQSVSSFNTQILLTKIADAYYCASKNNNNKNFAIKSYHVSVGLLTHETTEGNNRSDAGKEQEDG